MTTEIVLMVLSVLILAAVFLTKSKKHEYDNRFRRPEKDGDEPKK